MIEKQIKWRYILEFVGAISIVSSLIFVGIELRQAQQVALNERTISRVELGISARDSINQHPEIWIKGNKGEELTESEHLIYSNLLNNRVAEVDAIGLTALSLGFDIDDNLGVMGFSSFLHNNPGALKVWKEMYEEAQPSRELLSGDPQRMSRVRQAILEHLKRLGSNTEN